MPDTGLLHDLASVLPASVAAGQVVVIGLGYVGLPIALEAAAAGFTVTGFDLDPTAVRAEVDALRSATGITLDESYLEVRYLFPSADSWKLNDRTILCLAGNDDDQKTGSLKGSKPYRR